MNETVTVHVSNRLEELERAGQLVRDFAARHALAEHVAFEMTLALDEVLTNVITYAYEDRGTHDIVVQVGLDGSELHVRVEDDGRPFDPLTLPVPDTDLPVAERPVGGLGVHIVRRTTDALHYRREAGRNVLIMTKRLGR